MKAYIKVMEEEIESDSQRRIKNKATNNVNIKNIEGAAKDLSNNDLSILAKKYNENTDKRVYKYW